VVYDFCESRAGENAKVFLGDWRGSLVCDDFSGYKQLMTQGVTEVGCLAHARRKFFDLHASSKSQIAYSALEQIGRAYDIEREIKEFNPDERRRIRQERSKPLLDALHQWMILNRQKISQVLVPGDGEGRNGVWLAQQGHQVISADSSSVGLQKASVLATERGVVLTTLLVDLADWSP